MDGHKLTVAFATAKEAFAEAVDWQIVKKLPDVCINDGTKLYSVSAFASVLWLVETSRARMPATEVAVEAN